VVVVEGFAAVVVELLQVVETVLLAPPVPLFLFPFAARFVGFALGLNVLRKSAMKARKRDARAVLRSRQEEQARSETGEYNSAEKCFSKWVGRDHALFPSFGLHF